MTTVNNFATSAVNANKAEESQGLDTNIKSLADSIKKIEQNIEKSKAILSKLPNFKLDGLKDNYKGQVRLKMMSDGKLEVRGESKSKFAFLHKKRHVNEQNLAKKYDLNTTEKVNNLSSKITQLRDSIKNNESLKLEIQANRDQLQITNNSAPKSLQAANNSAPKSLQAANNTTKKSLDSAKVNVALQKGLVSVYGTNAGAKAINNAIRYDCGARGMDKPELSNLFNEAQKEWNNQNKNSEFSFTTSESQSLTKKALNEKQPKDLVKAMFSGAKRDGTNSYFRGTILSDNSALSNAKEGQLFRTGFILSCSTKPESAKRFTNSTYHSTSDKANIGKPVIYHIIGRPFNIGAGESNEAERNFKPGTVLKYKGQFVDQAGVVNIKFDEVNKDELQREAIQKPLIMLR